MKYAYSNDVNQAKSIMANIDRLKAPMTLVDTLPLVDEINGLERDLGALLVKQEEYSIAVDLLKDTGIKASIIDKYIPVLNTKINEMLDLIGFGVRLKFDNSFNESLIGRYADEFSYTSLSQGERERMNLAIMFAWQQVMQMASGIDCNVLVLDEIGASALDDDGIDAMFTILEKTCLSKNVIIISHNKQALAQCPAIIDVRKENGFTKIS
jgi:DNA repair exonuclease SbcCD ATPase subunit